MDLMELGAIGELVGGVAVVGSLIYVGLQVRQSNRLEKAESIRALQGDYVNTMLRADAPLLRAAVVDFEGMSKEDQLRAHNWLIAMYSTAQTEISLCEQNLADEGDNPPMLASFLRSRGFGYWWKCVGPTFSEDFQRYVENANLEHQHEPAGHELMPWLSPDDAASEGA